MILLDRPPVEHAQFEGLRPKHVGWLFSWPSYCVVALLVASALITFLHFQTILLQFVDPLSVDFHGYFSFCHLGIGVSSRNEPCGNRAFAKLRPDLYRKQL